MKNSNETAREGREPVLRLYNTKGTSFVAALKDMRYAPPHMRESEHCHNCTEIALCLEGSGMLTIADRNYGYEPGTVIIVPQMVPHVRRNREDEQAHWLYMAVDEKKLPGHLPQNVYEILRSMSQTHGGRGLCLGAQSDEARDAGMLIRQIFALRERKNDGIQAEIELMVLLMLVRIARIGQDVREIGCMGLDWGQIKPVYGAFEHVARSYAQPIRMEELARCCAMSESHFRKRFTQLVGIPPLEYVNRYRIKRSMNLLRSGGDSVQNVAIQVGFSSIATFNRNFQQYVGETPTIWRKKCREEMGILHEKDAE